MITYDRLHYAVFGWVPAPPPSTPEEQAEGYRRLAEWWRWQQYYRRFDRCCHGKRS